MAPEWTRVEEIVFRTTSKALNTFGALMWKGTALSLKKTKWLVSGDLSQIWNKPPVNVSMLCDQNGPKIILLTVILAVNFFKKHIISEWKILIFYQKCKNESAHTCQWQIVSNLVYGRLLAFVVLTDRLSWVQHSLWHKHDKRWQFVEEIKSSTAFCMTWLRVGSHFQL